MTVALPVQGGNDGTWGTDLRTWCLVAHEDNGTHKTTIVEPFVDWLDYGATTTTAGWAATPTKSVLYKKIGTMVYIIFSITGTSNADTTTSFTLPHTPSILTYSSTFCLEGTTYSAGIAGIATSGTVTLYKTGALTAWATSGVKNVKGQFFYQTA